MEIIRNGKNMWMALAKESGSTTMKMAIIKKLEIQQQSR